MKRSLALLAVLVLVAAGCGGGGEKNSAGTTTTAGGKPGAGMKVGLVTDVGGLMEVVANGQFGRVIPRKDAAALAGEITDLAGHPDQALDLGRRARQHVLQHYDWNNNLEKMMACYHTLHAATKPKKHAR